ncbi:MAG: HAMP domain-containing protein [Hyphomicrobiaceae bacterium]|nr:HAMP domain-containing protein [Hyphomicrobiaceae bacterium]
MRKPRFKRLSTQIYLTIVVTLLAVVLAAGAMWRRANDAMPMRQAFEVAGEVIAAALPGPTAPPAEVEATLIRFADRLRLDLALFDADRRLLAETGRPVPPPPAYRDEGGFVSGRGGPAWAVALPDGRWLVARNPRRNFRHPAVALLVFLGLIATLVGVGAFPVVRGLTRRLERLQSGVERLGSGDLAARVEVRGNDEIARLAQSFNQSAQRIEQLVTSQKMLLANASHELRTPLARLRMGLELSGEQIAANHRAAITRDINELDGMIDEILLLSRLGADIDMRYREPVDLMALAAEEAAHYDDCTVTGAPVTIEGDANLLRRLIRNLLENAARHGEPPIVVDVSASGAAARITVSDQGAGFMQSETEQVFEPFHRGARRGQSRGSGLGLALVRRIAERHNGRARITPGDDGVTLNRVEVILSG